MPTCPTCGKEVETERGLSIHHSRMHDKPFPGTVKTCETCGGEFEVKPCRVDTARFCSVDCRGEWTASRYESERPTVECEYCGNSYTVVPARESKTRFCSDKCRDAWCSENQAGENSVHWEGGKETLQCEYCGDEYNVRAARADESRFCSRDCQGGWMSENQTGQNHPMYRGGETPYGDNWGRQRKIALERDGECCQRCGVASEKIGKELDVHHIKPRHQFDNPARANFLANLITLCESCHGTVENGDGELDLTRSSAHVSETVFEN